MASDIVFARELHESLSSLIRDLLAVSTDPQPSAFIACTVRSDGMVQGFLRCVESKGLTADIVYDKSYSPQDGIISSHELLHPIKVIRIQQDIGDNAKLSDQIYF